MKHRGQGRGRDVGDQGAYEQPCRASVFFSEGAVGRGLKVEGREFLSSVVVCCDD